MKLSCVVGTENGGDAAASDKLTGMDCDTPPEAIVMLLLLMLASRPLGFTVTVTVAGVVVPEATAVTHGSPIAAIVNATG